MKIYTKTGDAGSTALFGGTRVPKHHLRVETYGCSDELNAHLGLLRDHCTAEDLRTFLHRIQVLVFDMGSHLATDPSKEKAAAYLPAISDNEVQLLEQAIDDMQAQLPALKHFILPGGHVAVSQAHIARTVCRRCERLITALAEHESVNPIILQFFNRLSDYLFVLSRYLGKINGVKEVKWEPRD
ncbi:MAG: cob(I)yrinic acid a,c-diamide adenosyltransferase [Saprospiraceae bacterium]|nr:cob(I)yrinic acid a,c-diamide adenosyltransferase [Saprospiraceae bacterium]